MKINTNEACRYFKETDVVMAKIVEVALSAERPLRIPQPKPVSDYFESIVNSIISQQISTKAAESIRNRVVDFLLEVTPERVVEADFDELKACGLSKQKTKYLKHNAEVWHTIPVTKFKNMSDEEIIAELTKLYGIGRWTAEMFLIFSMARPDVFSFGDLGLMKSLYRHYNYKPHYVRKIESTVESWSPHKTVASLALWHTIDNGPVLL